MHKGTVTITERDLEILGDLEFTNHLSSIPREWAAPIDCGGTNGSDHWYRLTKLVRVGYAEHRKRGYPPGVAPTRIRGSKLYRITDAGRKALAIHREGLRNA